MKKDLMLHFSITFWLFLGGRALKALEMVFMPELSVKKGFPPLDGPTFGSIVALK
jgi:hypothetical protein